MKTRTLIYTLAAAGLLCGSALTAAAQPAGGGRAQILSQEDRRAVTDATRDQMTQLRTDLQAAQKAAVQAALAENASESDVAAKVEAVAKLQAKMAMVNYKAVKSTVKLTDDQKAQMKENAMIGYFTLFGGGFGGGRGGRRGGGGGGANQQ